MRWLVPNALLGDCRQPRASAESAGAHLADINDINNWLGRSQYDTDPAFRGSYLEFRIYEAALTAAQIELSFAEGPDPAFLE